MKLSILVCSVLGRYDSFLPKMTKQLHDQYEALDQEDKDQVEIIILSDNKKRMLGNKRNDMVALAQGKYVVFVDDDDRIADDYIKQLLDATESDCDVIVFQAEVTVNDQEPKICYYSKDNKKDFNKVDFYRIPNHICCVKKSVSIMSSFPNIMYGEDAGYSKVLLPYLKTEHKIDKVLYYYDYSVETSETQHHRPNASLSKNPAVVDVIILSKVTNKRQLEMTQQTIDTCKKGANGLGVNITVVEQGIGKFKHAKVIRRQDKFNYNQFANAAASLGTAKWIMVANNDLVFTDGWLHELLAADHPIVSPHEPTDRRQADIEDNTKGYENGRHFSGWCFMIERKLWREIGKFDDCVDFWCSDDVVVEQLREVNIEPMLVKESIVYHQRSQTLKSLDKAEQDDLKWHNVYIFNQKYKQTKFKDNREYKAWLKNYTK